MKDKDLKKIKYFQPIGMDMKIIKNLDGSWGDAHRTLQQMLSYENYEAFDKNGKKIKK